MNKEQVHTLVIPDIHGRTFWKEDIQIFSKDQYPNLNIVFLGDYLDPYDFEKISRLAAIENFKEIINVAKNDNRVHLLIGNHDMHYWYDTRYKCRVDNKNYEKIKNLFLENFSLFNVAYDEEINGEKYLYTHAGVTAYWLMHLKFVGNNGIRWNKEEYINSLGEKKKKVSDEQLPFCEMLANMTPTAEELNKMKSNFQGEANLWYASWYRGGENDCGSCIWADFNEWSYENSNIDNIWQIFGHSLAAGSFDEGIIDYKKKIAMVDSRCSWVITNNQDICKLKDYK